MKIKQLPLQGLYLIEPRTFSDARGYFFQSYVQKQYQESGVDVTFVQDNVAFSTEGVIRALHYQSDPGQAKLVSCIEGAIWDVAVDIRKDSPTFGQWFGVELDDKNHHQLFIPVGFAHGYCCLTRSAKVHYKVSAPYNPETERSIRWDDPDLNIAWPARCPILSERDLTSSFFRDIAWSSQ